MHALILVTVVAVSVMGLPITATASTGADRARTAASAAAAKDAANDSDGDGSLDRPDAVSAAVTARTTKKPVEDLSARTESATTVVNPDGTRTMQDYGSPVRVQNDDESWSKVDFDLEKQADGTYSPRVSATETVVGGGATTSAAAVSFDDGSALSVTWPKKLPEPTIDGGVATYKIDDAMDLVVTVVDGGVSTTIRLNEKPTDADRKLALGLKSDGLKVVETAQGGLQATNNDGDKVGKAGTMIAWDARTDKAGDPLKTVPVAADLAAAGGSGFKKTHKLSLSAPDEFLDDPSTVYPVTIDPDISSVTRVRDTYVRNGVTTSNGTSYALAVGAPTNNTANPAVTFMQFDTSALSGKTILKSELGLWQYYGYLCENRQMVANPVNAAWVDAITWTNRPAGRYGTGDDAFLLTNKAAPGCAPGWSTLNVANMVDAWAHNTYPNYGFRLAVPAAQETYPSFERRFCSMNPNSSLTYCNTATTKPYLKVTYNSYPNRPASPSVSPGNVGYATTTTPTLSARLTDSDPGGTLTGTFEVWNSAGTQLVETVSGTAPNGQLATAKVPANKLVDGATYTVRVKANDGKNDSKLYSTNTTFKVDTSQPTLALASTAFSDTQWSPSTPASNTFTFTGSADTKSFTVVRDDVPTPPVTANASGVGSLAWVPTTSGQHTLVVTAVDKAGNQGSAQTFTFGMGSSGFTAPEQAQRSTTTFPLALTGPPGATGANLYWRYADDSTWISASEVKTASGSAWGGSTDDDGTGSVSPDLFWDATSEIDPAKPGAVAITAPALIELRTCFTYTGSQDSCSSPRTVQLVPDGFGGDAPTADLGPASVALSTGEMALSEADAVDTSAGLGRSFSSYDAATLTSTSTGAFGPGWQANTLLESSDAASDIITDNRTTDGTILISYAAGGSQTFAPETGNTSVFRPVEHTGDDTKLTFTAGSGNTLDSLALSTPMGSADTSTTWTLRASDAGGSPGWVLAETNNPGTDNDQEVTSDHQRVTWVEQSKPGASSNCTPTSQSMGCRGLRVVYTGTGASTRVASVRKVIYAQGTSAAVETPMAAYSYNSDGTLAQVCGPDPDGNPNAGDPTLCGSYTYTTQGGRTLLATATPPGQKPWRFTYDSTGRLTSVKRERPANDPSGGDATWSVDYSLIPTSTGLPSMSDTTVAQWGQTKAPQHVYAVHSPHAGTLDVTDAQLYYTGADGVVSNTAQYGPQGWLVDTQWRDARGNVVQSLDGAAWSHVMDAPAAERPAVAQQLSSYTIYNTWGDADTIGTRLMDEYGPAHTATLKDGTVGLFRTHVGHLYDDDPNVPAALTSGRTGPAVGLEVQQTTSTSDAERTADFDPQVVRSDYNPVVTGDGDGWALGTPTRVLKQNGPNIGTGIGAGDWSIAVTRFDSKGATIETRQPGGGADASGAGNDAHSTTVSYYTATGSGDCGGKPDWAGLVCKTGPAAQPSGTTIPVTWNHDYDTDLQPTLVRADSGGTTARTTTNTYDGLGRSTQTVEETTGSGVANETITTNYAYDASQGSQTTATTSGQTISTSVDSWGRTTGYVDALGGQSTTTYAADGQVKTVGDSVGTYTYSYDSHGVLASVDAGGGVGTFGYSWSPSGTLDKVNYPNGMVATRSYDETDAATALTYTQGGIDLIGFTSTLDARGRTIAASSTDSNQQYNYDRLDRLTATQDTGETGCTTRAYAFGGASERSAFTSYAPSSTDASCQTTTAQTTKVNTYDSAGRIRNSGYSYDTLGRTLTTPQVDTAPGSQGALTATYHANDHVASLSQQETNSSGGVDAVTMTYGLDPAARINSIVSATNGAETNRLRYGFSDGSDSPSIVDASLNGGATWTRTRYVDIPQIGLVAATTGSSTALQFSNLRQDVVGTIDNSAGASSINSYAATEEFGVAYDSAVMPRFGWKGGAERSNDALGGLMLMGARVYNPTTGSFLQADPIHGGGNTTYGYPEDPLNASDLTGQYFGIDYVEKKKWYSNFGNYWNASHHWYNYAGTKYLVHMTISARNSIANGDSYVMDTVIVSIGAAIGSKGGAKGAVFGSMLAGLMGGHIHSKAKKAKRLNRALRITFYYGKFLGGLLGIHAWVD